jgi:SAM-dependent methyltransferase
MAFVAPRRQDMIPSLERQKLADTGSSISELEVPPKPASGRKRAIKDLADSLAPARGKWRRKAEFFHAEDERFLHFLIGKGLSVLEIGCGSGDTLASLEPSLGVGVDLSAEMVFEARRKYPHLSFHVGDAEDEDVLDGIGGTFDVILIVDTMGVFDDCQAALEKLHRFCRRETRIIVTYYSHLWQPLLKLAEATGLRAPQTPQSVLSVADIRNFARLAGYDTIKSVPRLLCPFRLLGLGRLINRFLSPLPVLRQLSFRHYTVCRSLRHCEDEITSATVVIPARNERGNIEAAIVRLPAFCPDIEVIFIEGHSKDGTFEEMERVRAANPNHDIKVMRQSGKGKADAVFTAFDAARGDVLIILDADLTMPPEQLDKFWDAIRSGTAEFANGSRLVYPLADEAMRFLNLAANRVFSLLFTWLLDQRFTDTLCGTKVLRRSDYLRLKAGRAYFGDFDPFGDFDLIFGASKLNLKCIDIPIRYSARTYGETQISRFSHGLLLLRMVAFAFFRVKAL